MTNNINYEKEINDLDLFGSRDNYGNGDSMDLSLGKLKDKTTEMQKYSLEFEARLKGYMWDSTGNKLFYDGKCLAGKDIIQRLALLIHPFSREVLMISNKNKITWATQRLRTALQIIRILERDMDSDAKNFMTVFLTANNNLTNIGDIIKNNNSQDYLKGLFGIEKKDINLEDNKSARMEIPQ